MMHPRINQYEIQSMSNFWLYLKTKLWLPFAVGICIGVLSIYEWQQLKLQERRNIEYNTRQTAQIIHDQLATNLKVQILALERMGNRWNTQPPTRQIWQTDAEAYVQNMNHFQAISWVDINFIVRWIVPLKDNEAAVNFDLSIEERRRQALEIARNDRTMSITKPIDLVQGGKGFIAYVPLFPNDQFDGFISGVYRIKKVINNIVSEKIRANYAITLSVDDQPFYHSSDLTTPNTLTQTNTLNLYNLSWQIHVSPLNPEQFNSALPEISLIIGGVFSGLLTLVLFTAQKTARREKEITQLNLQLQTNESHLSAVLDTVLDGIITIDKKGTIQTYNTSAKLIFGYDAEEVIGKNVKILMPEPYHSEHDGYLHAHQTTSVNKIIGIGREVEGKRKNGTIFPMDLAVNQVELDGQVLYVGLVRDITDRKKYETALLTSEERFRTLTSFAPVGIYETDTEGNCLFVNERWCELTGLTPKEALGPGWASALHNDDQRAVFEAWQNAVLQKTEFSEEYRFQKPSGQVVWVSGRAIALTNENNQPRGYIGTVADITQLKEAERNIVEQEDRIRSLYEVSSKSGLSYEQQLKDALDIGCQRLGLSIGIVSHIAHEIYTIESVHVPNNAIERGTTFELEQTYCSIMLEANQPIAIHHMSESKWHNHPCYQNFQLEAYIGAPILVNNEPYGTLNFTSHTPKAELFKQSDIEFVQLMAQWISVAIERQQRSQTLATQLTQQNAILNISRAIQKVQYPEDLEQVTRIFAEQLFLLGISFESLSIHRLIDESQMIFENHTLINLSEYEKDFAYRPGIYAELKTLNITYRKDILLPEYQEGLPETYLQDHPSIRSILHIPFNNGTVALRSNSPNAFSEDDIALIQSNVETLSVGILRVEDLERIATRNENLEKTTAELARSNQELEQFAYVASHDLQEPLRVITNYLQLLDRRFGKNLSEDAKGYITRVTNGATRMSTLIKDLLSYSRITTQAKPFDVLNIEHLIENVKSDLEMAISESNAKITHDPLPNVKGDETQIKQVFQNLINNAIKFQSDTVPEVHISVTETQTHHQFSVSDNGIGIDPEFSERIFEIFQRLHTRDEYKGTGIGLAICKKIIERHGGDIWVESTPGEGATFSFTISKNPI